MSILWADFPSGDVGIYGQRSLSLLNGVYGAIDSFSVRDVRIAEDPDPNVIGNVLSCQNGTIAICTTRYVRPGGATPTMGVATRLWVTQLPSGDWGSFAGPIIMFRTSSATPIATISVMADGSIAAAPDRDGTGEFGRSAPVIGANAWNHIEVKCVRSATVGSIEVRVNGVTVLNLTNLNLGNSDIGMVNIGQNYQNATFYGNPYYKDVVYWDGSGTQNNDFLGTVQVYRQEPDADSVFNWAASTGSTGFNLIKGDKPGQLLTVSGTIANNDSVVIDGVTYQFKSGALSTSGTFNVAIGASNATALANLFNAINASGVAGTDYSSHVTANARVEGYAYDATRVGIRSRTEDGGYYTVSETSSALTWTDVYGLAVYFTADVHNDMEYISATNPPPAASEFSLTNLPPDIVTVKAMIPYHRTQKVDGGDGFIQTSIDVSGSEDAGADRPMTTAFTFWYDVSELSPVTTLPYTPVEANNALIKINRTI